MNSINPLVSIIVVTYNSSMYVLETLDSAYNQTYQNIELIIIDDFSKDNTVKIVEQWVEKYKKRFTRVKIIPATENRGIPANCNQGLEAAKGEWIKFIAGDDILTSNCLSDNIAFIAENNSYFIFSDLIWFKDNQAVIENDKSEDIFRAAFAKLDCEGQLKFYSRYPVFLNSPTWFFSKRNIKLVFDEDFKLLDDQPFIFLFLETKNRVYYMNKKTVKYRRHENSVGALNTKNYYRDFSLCFKKYRMKNLSKKSFIDLFFIFMYYALMADRRSSNNSILKVMYYPFRKVISVFKGIIKPDAGLSKFKI